MKQMWKFNTAHFSVIWLTEPDVLNTDYMDPDVARECRQKVRSGEWKCFSSVVRVVHRATKAVLAEAYLGNSIYADPREFRDHLGCRNKGYGSYFSDMVREAILETRKSFPAFQTRATIVIRQQQKALNCSIKPPAEREVCHGQV